VSQASNGHRRYLITCLADGGYSSPAFSVRYNQTVERALPDEEAERLKRQFRGRLSIVEKNGRPPAPTAAPQPHAPVGSGEAREATGALSASLQPAEDEWFPPRLEPLPCKSPQVSVLIRCYNVHADWLQAAIDSVWRQVGVTCEIVLVDDGSDEPLLPPADPRIGLLRFPWNRGLAEATTRGAARCRRTFIRMLDADDELPDGALAAQAEALGDVKLLCYGQALNLLDPKREWCQTDGMRQATAKGATPYEVIPDTEWLLVPGPSGMWRRSWRRTMPPSHLVTADDQLLARVGVAEIEPDQFVYLDRPVLLYRPGSPTSNQGGEEMPGRELRHRLTEECVEKARRRLLLHRTRRAHPRPLHVALVEHEMCIGGAQWHMALLCRELCRLGVDARVFTRGSWPMCDWLAAQGGRVEAGPTSRWPEWLERSLAEFEPDAVDHCWRVEEPQVTCSGKWQRFAHLQGPGALDQWAGKASAVEQTDRVVCVSQAMADIIPHWGDKRVVVPNGVDVDTFRCSERIRPAARAAYGIPRDARVVLWTGRMSATQKHVDQLRALINLLEPEGVWFLVGGFFSEWGGKAKQEAEWLEYIAGRRVVWVNGYLPWESAALYAACDVYASTSAKEGLSLSMLEAMAAARPVVVTDAGGQREAIFEGHNGWLVPIGAVDAIALKVRELLALPARERRDMGRFAQFAAASRYHIANTARETLLAYYDACGLRPVLPATPTVAEEPAPTAKPKRPRRPARGKETANA